MGLERQVTCLVEERQSLPATDLLGIEVAYGTRARISLDRPAELYLYAVFDKSFGPYTLEFEGGVVNPGPLPGAGARFALAIYYGF